MELEIRSHNRFSLGLKELWLYRELFFFFTWRDVKVKYKQTALGFLWAVFQPLIMAGVMTLGFGSMIAATGTLNMPYAVFAFSGFILWNIFSGGLTNAGNSMVSNANIIKKIYFPRLIIPISAILVSVIDFAMALLVFIPFLYFFGCSLKLSAILFIPASVVLTCIATFGLGTLLAAMNVKYRDFRYIIPFFIQSLLFVTPVIYPVKITGNAIFQWILMANPMYAPIELFRQAFTDAPLYTGGILVSILTTLILFVAGLVYFRKTETYFADLA